MAQHAFSEFGEAVQETLTAKSFPAAKTGIRVGSRFAASRTKYLRRAISTGIPELDQHIGFMPVDERAGFKNGQSCYKLVSSFAAEGNTLVVFVADADTLAKQMPFFQSEKPAGLLLMQSVEEEIRRTKGMASYNKLKALMKNDKVPSFCFADCTTTQLAANNDAPSLAESTSLTHVLHSVRYYQSLIDLLDLTKKYRLVYVTMQQSNVDLAKNHFGITNAFILNDYVSQHMNALYADLLISDAVLATTDNLNKKRTLFPEHLKLAELEIGFQNGKYLRGKFQCSRDNFLEATVLIQRSEDGTDKYASEGDADKSGQKKEKASFDSVFVCGLVNQNRAVQDDIVAVEVLPKTEWLTPTELLLDVDEVDGVDVEAAEEEETVVEEKLKRQMQSRSRLTAFREDTKPTARVVGIIKHGWREYCGMLKPAPKGGEGILQRRRQLFCPADKRIPLILVETQRAEDLQNQRIVVTLDRWSRNSRYPNGHISKILGTFGDRETENEVILIEHQVKHSKFSDEVLSCLPPTPWVITAKDLDERQDLRHLDIVSIDPPGCTDIDDALHCRPLNEPGKPNLYEVGVHIADVSHFLRPNVAMDREAAERCTTVYLVDRRIDMLPDLLSSNLCSLRPLEDRFAFSVLWVVDIETGDYDPKRTVYTKSIIRSRQAFTYERAQQTIDDANAQHAIAQNLRVLNRVAQKLKEKRRQAGALCLESTEVRFAVDSETHDPIDVKSKSLFETNSLVEEFMLLANVTVAQRIYEEFPEFAILRRHPAPPASNFEPLQKAVETQGVKISADSNKHLAESLDRAVKQNNRYFNTMLRLMTTRCMMQALYFCSGMQKYENFLHYGLATPIYTHFTSPIRRYADVLVHRLLAVAIGADTTYTELLNRQFAQRECNEMNFRHRMAQYAGRASVALFTMLFFRGKSVVEPGYIVQVKRNAIKVLVPRYGLESAIYMRNEKDGLAAFEFDEEEGVQVAKNNKSGVVLKLFDPVRVHITVDESSLQHHKLQLRLVEPVVPGFSYSPPNVAASTSVSEKEAEAASVLQLT